MHVSGVTSVVQNDIVHYSLSVLQGGCSLLKLGDAWT